MTLTTTHLTHTVHGDLDCLATEGLLTETMTAAESYQHQVADLTAQNAFLDTEITHLRALVSQMTLKQRSLEETAADLTEQNTLLAEELATVEAAALPEGATVWGAVTRTEIVAIYRRLSRVTRGPVPPAIWAGIEADAEAWATEMTDLARERITVRVRREVRRRRAAARRGTRR